MRLLGILGPRDDQAIVLRIFAAYIDLVRKLQRVFKLEPAGSKGVWGLDDHQHLVYLFGASQLIGKLHTHSNSERDQTMSDFLVYRSPFASTFTHSPASNTRPPRSLLSPAFLDPPYSRSQDWTFLRALSSATSDSVDRTELVEI